MKINNEQKSSAQGTFQKNGTVSNGMNGTLYVVGTPIGNLEDITLRALSVLKESDVILCEDTRVTNKLLKHYKIKTPTLSYHSHSGTSKDEMVIELLKSEKTLALVSDAGTPTISDPGAKLISKIREELKNCRIESVPGPSAITSALSIAGVPTDIFSFFGFPPHKKGRNKFFDILCEVSHTVVFYESPHRIMKALDSIVERCSNDKRITVTREMTKIFEEVVQGTSREVKDYFENHPEKIKGEFVVIIS